jgi:hypothetical protein
MDGGFGPIGHPHLDLQDPELVSRVRAAGHHLRPLAAYMGGLPTLKDGEVGVSQRAQIREAERFLADRAAWSDPDRFAPLEIPGLRGVRVLAMARPYRNIILLDGVDPVACIRSGLPFVTPAWRGRGLGALLVLISDLERGRFLSPAAYSVSGARARCSAHALQVRIVAEGSGRPETTTADDQGSGSVVTSMQTKL